MRVTVVLLGDGPGPEGVERVRARSRREGWERAEGDVVAFFDARYEAGSEWVEALTAAPVVGGYVWPGDGYRWSDWVYYVVEYGWKRRLAAGNIAYSRAAIQEIDELLAGAGMHDSRMDVRLARPPEFVEYIRERYRYSYAWGVHYVRPLAAALRLGLPLLVAVRVPWWRKPLTLPGVLLIGFVMAIGEIAGSWRGSSGKVNAG